MERPAGGLDYDERLAAERATFSDQDDVHGNLPEAAHRWSARHHLPKLNALGVPSIDELVTGEIARRATKATREVVVLSLGSGNGDKELGWLRALADDGVHNVRIRLLEYNPEMQERAAAAAHALGLADRVEPLVADFNTWRADTEHDVVVGYQVLHHVLELEHLYDELRRGLAADGVLVVHDMIGRNGHRRWPEALEVVERIWATLPPDLRRNAITGEVDEHYDDIDCAVEGFEGIRSQDVLPLLLERFHPGLFLAAGNAVDPFIDRVYGHNFDLGIERHRTLIDHIGTLDETLIDLGVLTPTRLTALFHPGDTHPLQAWGERTPARCVRDTAVVDSAGRVSFDPRAADPDGLVDGGGLVAGRTKGVFHDRWAGGTVRVPLLTSAEIEAVRISLHLPDFLPLPGRLTVRVDGRPVATVDVDHAARELTVPVHLPARRTAELGLDADWWFNPHHEGTGEDRRTLSYVLAGITLVTREL